MNDVNASIFIVLFKEAYEKCFGQALEQPLSETESKLFYNQILEQTGLVVGWKSLKNYSLYVLNPSGAKEENPSNASLDTLARYVLNAPYITETERKDKESHYPYWFQYKEKVYKAKKPTDSNKKLWVKLLLAIIAVAAIVTLFFIHSSSTENFADDFHSTSDDSMRIRGWIVVKKEELSWNKRNDNSGWLTLFTLRGDNWHDSAETPSIKNLLVRKISADCFTAEIHFQDFFPNKEWQQAGILLLEDTNFRGKNLRLSLGYNDYFGGFSRPKEIIIQAITSQGNNLARPEEIAHVPVFTIDSGSNALVKNNLQYSALRIEKKEDHFRLLYSCSPLNNFAFKEAATTDFDIQPRYIGIFALKGFVNDTTVMPVKISYFAIANSKCEKQ
jgi:hypothetical protein